MITLGTPAWEIVARAAVVYLFVWGGLRLMGKRELGQMTVFDLVVILLIANAVQNAMVGPDTSLAGGLIAAAVLLVLNSAITRLRRRGVFWGRLFEGTPTVLIQNGEFVIPNLHKEGVERQEVEMAMREHGVASVGEVQLAVLEVDGSISIVPNDSRVVRTHRHFRQMKKR